MVYRIVVLGVLLASPVAGDGLALVGVPKGQPVYAITTQGNTCPA